MIYYSTPFRTDKNIGKYYNDFMSRLGDDDWACFTDGDTMFTNPFFGNVIENATMSDYQLFTSLTNRVGTKYQLTGDWNEDRLSEHWKLGSNLKDYTIQDITNESPLSGVLILVSKKWWNKIGGCKEGCLGVDNDIHTRTRNAGGKVGLIKGLYMLHYYRGGNKNDKSHLL